MPNLIGVILYLMILIELLNNRGLKDAPFIAKLLKDKNISPDLIISSPALRTKLTLEFLLKKLDYKNEIIYDKSIYEAPYLNFLKLNLKILKIFLQKRIQEKTIYQHFVYK